MKNLILQHFTGKLRPLDSFSIENIQRYAKRIGVEYRFIEGQVFREHLTAPCQKVHILDEKWDDYDNVLMLDIDMFATKGLSVNVFDYPGVGLFAETQSWLKQRLASVGRISTNSGYWSGAFYKLTREQRQSLRAAIPKNDSWMDFYNKLYHYEDEGIISELFHRSNTSWENCDPMWQQDSFKSNKVRGMIHIRTKITPQGPKQEKMLNYMALVEKGILE